MARSAKPRKRKPAPQRSKLPRYVVKLHDDDFFDEEDAEALRFDNFDDAVECCADLNIPGFTSAAIRLISASNHRLWNTKDQTQQILYPLCASLHSAVRAGATFTPEADLFCVATVR